MKEHTEQHLDNLARKVMKSSTIESTSVDFTANVMHQIENVSIIKVNKPLISNLAWVIIIASVAGIIAYVNLVNGPSSSWFENVDLSIVSKNKVTDAVSSITFSKILMYAIAFFGVSWFIQIQLMKHQLGKRLNY